MTTTRPAGCSDVQQLDVQVDAGSYDLAKALLVEPGELVELFGGHWIRLEAVGHEDEPEWWRWNDDVTWFVSGDPVQVLLSVANDLGEEKVLRCHCAEITWYGHEPRVTPGRLTGEGPRYALRDWLPTAIKLAQRARRRRFRSCSLCRTLNAPEHMSDGVCHGCTTSFLGVVF